MFKGYEFSWKMDGPKVSTFGPTLTPRFPLKMAEIKKMSRNVEKLQLLSYPNMSKL